MALRIRFQYPAGASLGYSIERLGDGLLYDFASSGASAGTFAASPATPIAVLPADSGMFSGRYKATLASTPAAKFTDGEYCVTIHDMNNANTVVGALSVTMRNGDDAPVFPGGSGGETDPWSTPLPAGYPAGTAGAILGRYLDAAVSSRVAASSYVAPPSLGQIVSGVWDEPRAGHAVDGSFGSCLDAAVSSRLSASAYTPAPSLSQIVSGVWDEPSAAHVGEGSFGAHLDAAVSSRYDGRADVPGVAAPVTVGTSLDKAGYRLGPDGLDAVDVEPGINARQALAPILAAVAGVVTGSGSGTIVIKGGNTASTRIMATTDPSGNRSAVTLLLPD
jgi:hypothetical protein